MWALHDRLEDGITEVSCRLEIESFSRHGQLMPVLGRRLKGDAQHDVELIYGARRLFVARHINKPLLVRIDDEISDRQAIVAMDIENRHRLDISAYERGLSYTQWLRKGYFRSQEELAQTLKLSASRISRLLRLARLPSIVVGAFASPADICEAWGLELVEALAQLATRAPTLKKARELAALTPRLSARNVYRELLGAPRSRRKLRTKHRDEVVTDHLGAPLFRIRRQESLVTLYIPVKNLSPQSLERIRHHVSTELHESRASRDDRLGASYRGSDPAARNGGLRGERVTATESQ
jgi:ParB family chromosome partitioning protein